LTRRKDRSASSIPAAIHRFFIVPSPQFFTPAYPANVCWGWRQEVVVLRDIRADHPPLGRIVVLLMTHDFRR
jgi:hypothetical protein